MAIRGLPTNWTFVSARQGVAHFAHYKGWGLPHPPSRWNSPLGLFVLFCLFSREHALVVGGVGRAYLDPMVQQKKSHWKTIANGAAAPLISDERPPQSHKDTGVGPRAGTHPGIRPHGRAGVGIFTPSNIVHFKRALFFNFSVTRVLG